MLSLIEVIFGVLLGLLIWYNKYQNKEFTKTLTLAAERLEGDLLFKMQYEVETALREFEDLAEEVVPEAPDPFEAMQLMRANMVNQVLGFGVNWVAEKFTNMQMGVHQIENVNSPNPDSLESWHDADAEQQREEPAEVADSM
jgi:hypothetical protein